MIWIRYLAWAWLILIGVILITPIGPLCIACGRVAASQNDYIFGAISIVLGIAGFVTAARA